MKKPILVTLAAIGLIAAAIGFIQFQPSSSPQASPQSRSQDEGSAPFHPLMVEAIQKRPYTAGPITTEREVSAFTGYRSQVVSYRSDGFKVYALMNTPTDPAPTSGWPVLILSHGYIQPQAYQTLGGDYQYWIEGLTRAGFVVIKPDYRGHGQSEGTAEGGHWSPVYTYDVLNLTESLKRHPGVDARNIGLIGHSMGGNVVLRAVVASKDIKASAILAGVVASAPDLYNTWRGRNWSPPPGAPTTRQKIVDALGEPKANPDFWHKISAINYVKAATGPVQIHHGTNDDTVPKAYSDSLQTALQQAGRRSEYFVYDGGDHQFSSTSDLALQRMIALFNAELKSGS